MALLFLGEPNQSGIAFVSSIVYQTQYLDEETIKKGINVVDKDIPVSNTPEKDMLLKYDVNKNEFIVDYVERPANTEEAQKKLQEENKQLGQQVTDLEILVLQKDQDIKLIAQQLSDLEIEVLKMKQAGGTV
ncbi:TPA: hypothetical protein ROY30_005609 [Bacillus cereus]|uniref:hypothetical protein n=1 Tax=Bacillales TaxID=1385 RepID=UPI001C2F9CE7|nr:MULTISPECIES: hypothetical protein [Bacillales]MCP1284044.1 hypothetical protein [Bacillus sp. S0635]MCQ6349663.1 hypothetical protein [Bacillus cereus]HDX9631839.1 hypothetical protein [Bacillus cereus]